MNADPDTRAGQPSRPGSRGKRRIYRRLFPTREGLHPYARLVFLFGRDVPRLLAIGLSFFPGYIAILTLRDAFSSWSSGR
jgi:hypothetical protein